MASAPGRKAVIILQTARANRAYIHFQILLSTSPCTHKCPSTLLDLGRMLKKRAVKRLAGESGGEYSFTPTPGEACGLYETKARSLK